MESSVVEEVEAESANEIKTKMHFTGKVVKIILAGAVVDIGTALPGVLHISQLVAPTPEQAIKRVEDVLQAGQTVEVWVKKVKEDRIELTMIKPLDLEWRDLKKGMTVKGQVVRLEKFGAFVEIGAERPGLIHISELAHGYVRQPSDVVKEGDEVEAQVLDVNRRKKQIKLSLKALQEEPVKVEEPARLIETVQKERSERSSNRRRRPNRDEGGAEARETFVETEESTEPDPTAMEIAMREAMERARSRKGSNSERGKRREYSAEREDILARTLEQKARSS